MSTENYSGYVGKYDTSISALFAYDVYVKTLHQDTDIPEFCFDEKKALRELKKLKEDGRIDLWTEPDGFKISCLDPKVREVKDDVKFKEIFKLYLEFIYTYSVFLAQQQILSLQLSSLSTMFESVDKLIENQL